MTLRRRISVGAASVFSVFLALACILIYSTSAQYRKTEFINRLQDKALTTAKLLLEVKEVDKQLLKLIDQNTIYKLLDEKTIVFDDASNLIYSSLDDTEIRWNQNDLDLLKKDGFFYRNENDTEVVGMYYDFEQRDYFVITSARDKYGKRKLAYLMYILLVTFFAGSILVWISTRFLIKSLLLPLENFKAQIVNISANKLNHRITGNNRNDEIETLANSFNSMIERIDGAFESQKEFTANASHELKTPLTRIAFQLEGMMQNYTHPPEVLDYLKSIKNDVHQMSDLINTLLLLSRLEKQEKGKDFEKVRVDELIFAAYEEMKKLNPLYDMKFEIVETIGGEYQMEVMGIKALLQIAVNNLIKNAFLYASHNSIQVKIISEPSVGVQVLIENEGQTISKSEQMRLFSSFMRGSNATKVNGYGLGLRITKRILQFHNADLAYESPSSLLNRFRIGFKI
ncbi:sensor histidine kinase [Arcticibacterium luteifluviistationis]|uniref:histidine kinase n=1 Tax=Arcticibacterium luteifluviistationis TaxID=1784714 RepID=A0A2Z4GI24_9BACT|nr:HAMP domain-containing sensor histidine kinase [Arcticibacterium luteifluviistationis]AWW00619.1 sensor histidine kinase [Arcticibacterium luteifluviistationis]